MQTLRALIYLFNLSILPLERTALIFLSDYFSLVINILAIVLPNPSIILHRL